MSNLMMSGGGEIVDRVAVAQVQTPQRVDYSYAALNRAFGLDGNRPELW